ncbi:MAG: hypothetical protein ACI4IS_00300 [Acutalibacteraceae bacterium]
MRGFTNYNDIQEYTDIKKLPPGAYEIKILRAEEQTGANNSCALCLLFDISSGEFKDYYMDRFKQDRSSTNADKAKYKGVLRLWYPNGGQYDESNEKKIKTALERIKKSNNLNIDFSKEWDGAALKGCKVGMIFREKEYDFNGSKGFFAEPFSIIELDALKSGNFTLPAPKYLNGSAPSATQAINGFATLDDGEDDLPF